MMNILKKFYFFSKLTTNLALVTIIFFMGYLFFKSYGENKTKNNNIDKLEEVFIERLKNISDSIYKNSESINLINNKISKKIEKENLLINLDKKQKLEESQYLTSQMSILLKENQILKKEIKSLSDKVNNLNEYKKEAKINNELNINNESNNNNIKIYNNIIDLINTKYDSGLNVKQELNLLKKINKNNNNNPFIEKLFILSEYRLVGANELSEEYFLLMKSYLKLHFIEKNDNILIRYLSPFITIKPSQSLHFENEVIKNFSLINSKIENNNFEQALDYLELIQDSEIYFKKWIIKVENYLEFKKNLDKISLAYD